MSEVEMHLLLANFTAFPLSAAESSGLSTGIIATINFLMRPWVTSQLKSHLSIIVLALISFHSISISFLTVYLSSTHLSVCAHLQFFLLLK